ncbi:MAG: fumarylacetoacetate hydrolase family protein [Bacteroidetes bacterium]|nr:fumarylacetoacetate hydrolase family protein [Bacteroidota bacterium]
MKIITYSNRGEESVGILHEQKVYPINQVEGVLVKSLEEFLQLEENGWHLLEGFYEFIKKSPKNCDVLDLNECEIQAPLKKPNSLRDAYAFKQHVATSRMNRGVEMIPEFDQYPVFYFSNHNAIQGPYEDVECMPDHFQKLDFELEIAIIIGKQGRNIKAQDADQYIAGFTILNDFSARRLQMEEMKLNLGPAKGKDFSSVIGPYLVTPNELEENLLPTPEGHIGKCYDLEMKCWVNGELLSSGNMSSMYWTFAEIIERCSYGVTLYPGDIIGSGTVGTGCLLEINGTNKRKDPSYQGKWLENGDVVEMEISKLGRTKNKIITENSEHSILELKK